MNRPRTLVTEIKHPKVLNALNKTNTIIQPQPGNSIFQQQCSVVLCWMLCVQHHFTPVPSGKEGPALLNSHAVVEMRRRKSTHNSS